MNIMNRLVRAVERGSLDAGRTRARRYLLGRGDRFLADAGLSRELLEQGNGAWPWRVETPTVSIPMPSGRASLAVEARSGFAALGAPVRPVEREPLEAVHEAAREAA